MLSYLDAFPGFALRFNTWDLIGTAAYTLAFALLESLILLLPLILAAVLLPPRIFRDRFLSLGATVIIVSSIWIMVANAQRIEILALGLRSLLLPFTLYLLSLAIPVALIVRIRSIEIWIQAVVSRFSVLAYFYVALACLGLVIVVLRSL
jgi:hypothetical protein